MLKTAKQKLSEYPQVSWQTASASQLPFSKGSFDLIVCASSFHYFDNPHISLTQMKRVLKSDGRAVILDWSKDYWICRIIDLVLKVFDPAYQQCYTQRKFHSLLTAAGFEIDRAAKFKHGILWEFMVAEVVLPSKRATR